MRIGSTTLTNYTAWCRLEHAVESSAAQSRAWERLQRVVEDDRAEGLRALIYVSRALADDENALVLLGADALEDLFRLHADVLLGRLQQGLADDEPLRLAARSIWLRRHESYHELRELIEADGVAGDISTSAATTDLDASKNDAR